jgi:hypothetical protein
VTLAISYRVTARDAGIKNPNERLERAR